MTGAIGLFGALTLFGACLVGCADAAEGDGHGDAGKAADAAELRGQMVALTGQVSTVDALTDAAAFPDVGVREALGALVNATTDAESAVDLVVSLAGESPLPREQIRRAIVDGLLIELRRVSARADTLGEAVGGAQAQADTEQLGDNIQQVHSLAYALGRRVSAYLTSFQEPIVRDFGVHLGPLNPRHLPNEHTLVAETSGNRVVELGEDGTVVWQYTDVAYPTAAERLANGNTLIADRDGMRAVEIGAGDAVVWEKGGLVGLYGVQRLDSGNTLLTVQGDYTEANPAVIIEVNTAGDTVWSFGGDDVGLLAPSAQRLPNGNTLIGENSGYFGGTARVIEINPEGETVWTFTTGIYGVYGVRPLDNGNTLIGDQSDGRLIEVTSAGDLAWRYGGLDTPGGVDVLSDGRLLIADWSQNKLFEIGPR